MIKKKLSFLIICLLFLGKIYAQQSLDLRAVHRYNINGLGEKQIKRANYYYQQSYLYECKLCKTMQSVDSVKFNIEKYESLRQENERVIIKTKFIPCPVILLSRGELNAVYRAIKAGHSLPIYKIDITANKITK